MKIETTLDPIFETLILLMMVQDTKEENQKLMERFGDQWEQVLDSPEDPQYLFLLTYLEGFRKQRQKVPHHQRLFPKSSSWEQALVLYGVLLFKTELWEHLPEYTDSMLRRLLLEFYQEGMEEEVSLEMATLAEYNDFLENSKLEESLKWSYLNLLLEPKATLTQVMAAIRLNLPAYEKALKKVKPYKELLDNYQKEMQEATEPLFFEKILPNVLDKVQEVLPCLIVPGGLLVIGQKLYAGLLVPNALKRYDSLEQQRELLMQQCKVLSEKSKLEILLMLKQKPMTNTEISEQTGLAPSTVSHHMGTLLGSNFIFLTINDKKSQLEYNQAEFETFIKRLKQFFC